MKTQKYMMLGLALVLVALISPISAKASVDTDLRYGSRGGEVTELQEFLIDNGFLTGSASGNFYALTRKAVVAYQASVGLPVTGFVGPMTRGEINKELALNTSEEETQATPVVTTSPDVSALLAKLAELQAQLKTSQEAQLNTQNQTNQILGAIAQNTTPVQVPVGAPATTPVVVTPTPTCTLTASTTIVDDSNHKGNIRFSNITTSVGWTSENATGGTLYFFNNRIAAGVKEYADPIDLSQNSYINGIKQNNSISSGYLKGFGDTYFKAVFSGNDIATCYAKASDEQTQKVIQDAYNECKEQNSERLDLCSYWTTRVSDIGGVL